MSTKTLFRIIIITVCLAGFGQAHAKKIHNKKYKFRLEVPETMKRIDDRNKKNVAPGTQYEDVYYDTTTGIVMILSAREGKFKSVEEYMNCAHEDIESHLRAAYGDSTFTLVACRKASLYPNKTTIIQFRVSALPSGFNTYIIYFIHNRKKDIQISFTYRQRNENESIEYIDKLMQTLKLR